MPRLRVINLATSEDLGTYEAEDDMHTLALMSLAHGWTAPDGSAAVFAEADGGEYIVLEDDPLPSNRCSKGFAQ